VPSRMVSRSAESPTPRGRSVLRREEGREGGKKRRRGGRSFHSTHASSRSVLYKKKGGGGEGGGEEGGRTFLSGTTCWKANFTISLGGEREGGRLGGESRPRLRIQEGGGKEKKEKNCRWPLYGVPCYAPIFPFREGGGGNHQEIRGGGKLYRTFFR